MDVLTGGRAEAIYRKGDVVYRPLRPWSPTILKVLEHLHAQGLDQVPKVLGVEGNQEKLSFVDGQTYQYPLTGAIAQTQALQLAARLLRTLHDASESLLTELDVASQVWMLPPRPPYEVICHGDFAPYNVALVGDQVIGVFDFDTAHPAPRVWDLAFSVYCWAPFKAMKSGRSESLTEQIYRAKMFCDGYLASETQRHQIPKVMIERLTSLVNYMHQEAEKGDEKFSKDIEAGHHLEYTQDITYIQTHQDRLRLGLLDSDAKN